MRNPAVREELRRLERALFAAPRRTPFAARDWATCVPPGPGIYAIREQATVLAAECLV
jgi:hypothetical protein